MENRKRPDTVIVEVTLNKFGEVKGTAYFRHNDGELVKDIRAAEYRFYVEQGVPYEMRVFAPYTTTLQTDYPDDFADDITPEDIHGYDDRPMSIEEAEHRHERERERRQGC
jgi:hypothetical protein